MCEFSTASREGKQSRLVLKHIKVDGKFNWIRDQKTKLPVLKNEKPRGEIEVSAIEIFKSPTFINYLEGGMKINCSVAIDFTGSNQDPSLPQSLHYRYGPPNQYIQAIQAVLSVLASYDDDQMFPVWGFGAKLVRTQQISHCFPLTLNPHATEVCGIGGILQAYNNIFPHILLSGPTCFEQIVRAAAAKASSHPFNAREQHYSILLILTDGVINDMQQTADALVAASGLPLSVRL